MTEKVSECGREISFPDMQQPPGQVVNVLDQEKQSMFYSKRETGNK